MITIQIFFIFAYPHPGERTTNCAHRYLYKSNLGMPKRGILVYLLTISTSSYSRTIHRIILGKLAFHFVTSLMYHTKEKINCI